MTDAPIGQADPSGLIMPNLVFSPDQRSARLNAEVVHEALFADCSDTMVTAAHPELEPGGGRGRERSDGGLAAQP